MVKKTIYFDVMLKSSDRINLNDFKASQKVMTNDKNSVDIVFRATDVEPNDLNGATASIFLYMQDGSFFQSNSVVITNNILTYTMTQNQTQHKGTTKVQIVVKSGTIDNASLLQEFEISPGLEKYPLTEVMIQDWTTLTEEAKAFVEQIEGFTLEQFVENKMGQELANLEVNYATRLTGLEKKDNQLTAQLQQTEQTLNAHLAVKGSGVSTNLSLRNGWVGTVRWRKSDGDVVTIEVDVANPTSISPLNDIATLPASIRTFEKVLPVVSTTTGTIEFLYINAGGILRTPAQTTMQTGKSYHGVIVYTI